MKTKALEIANELVELIVAPTPVEGKDACKLIDKSVIMIRQLVEELENADAYIDNLKKQIQHFYKQGYRQEHCCPNCGCHFVGEYLFYNTEPQYKELSEQIEELENALVYLCVKCRTDLDCEGSSKQIINWVHDYCSAILKKASEK